MSKSKQYILLAIVVMLICFIFIGLNDHTINAIEKSVSVIVVDEGNLQETQKIAEYFALDNNIELWHYSGGYWRYKNITIYDKDLEDIDINPENLVNLLNDYIFFEIPIDEVLYNKLVKSEDVKVVCKTTLPGKKIKDLFSGIPQIEIKNKTIYFKAKPKFNFYFYESYTSIIGEKLNVNIPIVDPEYGYNAYAIWNRFAEKDWGGALGYYDKNDPFAFAPVETGRISPAQIKNSKGHLLDGFTFKTGNITRNSNNSSVGYGTFMNGGAVGIHFDYPIIFEFYSGKIQKDLWLQLEELPSSVVVGDKVQVVVQVKSSFEQNLSKDSGNAPLYNWEIVDKSTNQPISPVTYEGYAKMATGNIEIAANGETALYAEFVMPQNDVEIRFEINKDGTIPKETLLENNVLDAVITTSIPISTTGAFDLDYNVLSRDVKFPLAGGKAIIAKLTAPSGNLYGDAWGALKVNNYTPTIFRSFNSNDLEVNQRAGTIVKYPEIEATINRKDATYDFNTKRYDNPLESKWLKGPDSMTVDGKVSFGGTAYGNYEYKVKRIRDDGSTYTERKTSTTSAAFNSGTDTKSITTYIYNGKSLIPAKTFENKIDYNYVNYLRKNMFWTSEPYKLEVIRWMCRQREDDSLYEWTVVPGEFKRTFTQQNSGVVNWAVVSNMKNDYMRSREAARKGDRRKTEYDKAVFASDIGFKNIDYPIKSGYYFNPTGKYTFTVETVTYKTNDNSTKDHKDLVDAVIDSFRYDTDLMYINSKKEAVNIQNEVLTKSGNDYVRRPAALTAKDPNGVDGLKLLYVEKTGYVKDIEELKHSQKSGEYTHEYLKAILEGYEESGTIGSKNNYKYREYIKDGQSIYKIIEKTTVTIQINPLNIKLYTHVRMPDGKYTVAAWIGDIPLSSMENEYKKLGVLRGVMPLDQIEVTVNGTYYDDQNAIIEN